MTIQMADGGAVGEASGVARAKSNGAAAEKKPPSAITFVPFTLSFNNIKYVGQTGMPSTTNEARTACHATVLPYSLTNPSSLLFTYCISVI